MRRTSRSHSGLRNTELVGDGLVGVACLHEQGDLLLPAGKARWHRTRTRRRVRPRHDEMLAVGVELIQHRPSAVVQCAPAFQHGLPGYALLSSLDTPNVEQRAPQKREHVGRLRRTRGMQYLPVVAQYQLRFIEPRTTVLGRSSQLQSKSRRKVIGDTAQDLELIGRPRTHRRRQIGDQRAAAARTVVRYEVERVGIEQPAAFRLARSNHVASVRTAVVRGCKPVEVGRIVRQTGGRGIPDIGGVRAHPKAVHHAQCVRIERCHEYVPPIGSPRLLPFRRQANSHRGQQSEAAGTRCVEQIGMNSAAKTEQRERCLSHALHPRLGRGMHPIGRIQQVKDIVCGSCRFPFSSHSSCSIVKTDAQRNTDPAAVEVVRP